mgnify:CR=1 FL=1
MVSSHKRTLILIQRLAFFLCPESLAPQGFFQFAGCMERAFPLFFGCKRRLMLISPCFTLPVGCMIKRLLVVLTAYRKIDSEIKHPPVVELRKSKLRYEGRFMSRTYTHVQELLPSVLAMKEEGYTYRQTANQFGLAKEQIEERCSRARRKQRRIEKGYIPQPKGRPRKAPATQEQLQNNRIVELEMKVELLQNFLSECGRM